MVNKQTKTHLGYEVLLVGAHQRVGLGSGQFTLGEMCVHFVPVEIGVVGLAVGVVEPQDLESAVQWLESVFVKQ